MLRSLDNQDITVSFAPETIAMRLEYKASAESKLPVITATDLTEVLTAYTKQKPWYELRASKEIKALRALLAALDRSETHQLSRENLSALICIIFSSKVGKGSTTAKVFQLLKNKLDNNTADNKLAAALSKYAASDAPIETLEALYKNPQYASRILDAIRVLSEYGINVEEARTLIYDNAAYAVNIADKLNFLRATLVVDNKFCSIPEIVNIAKKCIPNLTKVASIIDTLINHELRDTNLQLETRSKLTIQLLKTNDPHQLTQNLEAAFNLLPRFHKDIDYPQTTNFFRRRGVSESFASIADQMCSNPELAVAIAQARRK